MDKPVEIRFDTDAFKEYNKLQELVVKGSASGKKPTYAQLLSSINNALRNIKSNPYFGDLIPKKCVSKATANKYGTYKILRVELVGYWRLLYTLIGEEVKIVAFILEYMDHNSYNKVFGYKKR